MEPIYTATLANKGKTIVFGPQPDHGPPPSDRVVYSSQRIRPDDTIETIKRKILIELQSVAYDEIYLFANVQPFLTVARAVHLLTCGKRFPISRHRLITLCQNLKSPQLVDQLCKSIGSDTKTDYTDDELSEFLLAIQNSVDLTMDVPLGQTLQYDYPMPADPFHQTVADPFLKKAHADLVKTQNKNVLLEYGVIHDNVIHVCCAGDVLRQIAADDVDAVIKLYFPYLHEKGIGSLQELDERRQELLDATRPLIDDAFVQHNAAVDLLYNVHSQRQSPGELHYAERGIKSLHFIMRPITPFTLPLDSLFKVLHSAQQTPLIKYNPQGQREKVYRLYAPGIAKNGNRIPVLTKAKIVRLDGEIGKRRRVAAFMERHIDSVMTCEVVCEFDAEANVHVKAQFRRAVQYAQVFNNPADHVLRECLNPILDEVNGFLQSAAGKTIERFCSIAVPTVEIVDIVYTAFLLDTPMVRAQTIMGCVSSVFTVVSETADELSMRYKRVSNYDDRLGAEAYISERVRKDATVASIVSGLVKNRLVKTEEEAMQRVADYRAEEQAMETAHRRMARIKQPGFLTVMRRENTELHIEISDITQVWYMRLLEIYLDALIRIGMYRDRSGGRTTRVSLADMELRCAKRAKRAVAVLKELNEDVVAAASVPEFISDLSFEDRIALERAQEREAESVGAMEEDEDEYAGLGDVLDIMGAESDGSESDASQSGGAPRKKTGAVASAAVASAAVASAAVASAAVASAAVASADEDDADMVPLDDAEYAPQSLKNPNPFEYKLQKSEPILFLSKKTGNYDTYSTNCQSNIKRQPVVLSKKEYDALNADPEMRPMLKDALEYGSDPSNKYYYMCPRYWSFKDRRPMTEQEVKDKNLEKHVIGKKDKEVTLDKYIFEFNDYGKEHMGAKGYIPHYPGFLNTSVHPNGLCVPCCFKKKQQFADLKTCEDKLRVAKGQTQKAEEPEAPATEEPVKAPVTEEPVKAPEQEEPVKAPEQEEPVKAPATEEPVKEAPVKAPAQEEPVKKAAVHKAPDEYIMGPDKFPIPKGRRGYLPQAVQRFLNYDNRTCQVSSVNKTLKIGVKCLLRHGVQEWDKDAMGRDEKPSQLSELQSFIACMAALRQDDRPKSIAEMKQIILDGITLDSFLTYQNGTLVDAFKPQPGEEKEVHVSASIYSKTKYVQKMKPVMKNNPAAMVAVSNTINAYENFRRFIESNDTVIDHTYMWDIFTTFNPKIFTQKVGFNLIILEVPKDDNSDALNIVCPSNHYSNNFFDVRKMTVVLIKQYNYYEPLFQFTENEDAKKTDVKTSFSLSAPTLMPNLKIMIDLIKNSVYPGCAPVSIPNAVIKPYTFKYNISASEAMDALKRANIVVNEYVINYDSKIVGLVAEKRTAERLYSGIVMTAASPLNMPDQELDLVMMDDPEIWGSYADTLAFLAFVHKETKGKIPCLPRIKVMDDSHLIGIITETNQFMEIRPHIPEPMIPVIKTNPPMDEIAYNTTNLHALDAAVQTGVGEDAARVRYVQRVQLETEMYDMFRNSMRIMINKVKHIDKKKRIEELVYGTGLENRDSASLREIMQICREMGDPVIHFTRMQPAALDAFISNHEFKSSSKEFMRCISAESRIEYGANSCMRTAAAENPSANECTIILPDINLINGIQNRTFYYGKLADELLRYTRVRRFILSGSASMMSLTPVQYDLNPDEIILFHSQLDAHFENLEPGGGSVARYNTFYTANPDLNPREIPSNQFTRSEDLEGKGNDKGKGKASVKQAKAKAKGKSKDNGKEDEEEEEEEEEEEGAGALCAPVTLKPLSGRACAHYFPASMQLLSFENAKGECTFEAFLSMLREEKAGHASTTVHDLKAILVSKYRGLVQTHKVQMMNYYKHLTANRTVLAVSVDDFIMNAFHYMTHLDLWILAQHFRMPIVLFSAQQQHPLVENRAPALVLYHDADLVPKDPSEVQLYYVMSMGRQRDVAPVYSVVRNGENELKFSLSQCTNAAFVEEIMRQVAVFVSNPHPDMDWVEDFVANYVPAAAAKRITLKEVD